MSNQITEHTIETCYVIKVQNGHLDFILKFAILCRSENPTHQCSVLLGLGYNKPTYEKRSDSLRVCVREGCC